MAFKQKVVEGIENTDCGNGSSCNGQNIDSEIIKCHVVFCIDNSYWFNFCIHLQHRCEISSGSTS